MSVTKKVKVNISELVFGELVSLWNDFDGNLERIIGLVKSPVSAVLNVPSSLISFFPFKLNYVASYLKDSLIAYWEVPVSGGAHVYLSDWLYVKHVRNYL